jgi:deferrochelatase/peroxidase EfeB
MKVDRRRFLTRAGLGAVTTGAIGAGLMRGASAGAAQLPGVADPSATMAAVPFHGAHQAGILMPPPLSATFVSLDVVAATRGELVDLLKTLTATVRFLAAGGAPPNLGSGAPPSDSGTLGATVPADGLTVTLGMGSSLFDDRRYGLAARKPVHLTPMRVFPNDDLDPALTGGDLVLQICAGSPDTTLHALRQIARATRGGMQVNWRLDGFRSPSRPSGVPRNHFAFKDGIVNPDMSDPAVADRLLWITPGVGEPAWATGGTYHVVRIIQQFTEFWDRVSLSSRSR